MVLRKIGLRRYRSAALIGLALLLTFTAGGFSALYLRNRNVTQRQNHYNLLSRRVIADNPSDILINFRTLQETYQNYLAQNGLTDSVSLYFEYLPTGSSIGINEDTERFGASLLKLPLAVSVYKLAESGKINLDESVTLKKEWLNSDYGDLYKKGVGYRLTYRQAMQHMLRNSDNTAALLLFDKISKIEGSKSLNILGFVDANYATTSNAEVMIGTQSYSSILKCLYYSCYVSADSSQQILRYLTESDDNKRLTLFTPDSLKVAHKIGTYRVTTQSDCGIFYVPKRNYTLCIMVQGQDPQASRIIADLSLKTYEYISPSF